MKYRRNAGAVLSILVLAALPTVPCVAAPAAASLADRQASPTWSIATRAMLDQALEERATHGLDRVSFLTPAPDAEPPQARDARYTQAALSYAGALAHGRIDPATLHEIYTLERPNPDLGAGLDRALADGRLTQWLSELAPQDDGYAQLSKAYLFYRQEATSGPTAPPIEVSAPIQIGDRDPRVAEIAQQLVDDDYLASLPDVTGQMRYSQAIADAVAALQRDYGIAADGVVGPDTLAVLNMGAGDRARAIAVALERRRWLLRTPPATRIDVNIAAARLQYWRDGALVDERRVIVGQPDRETPMLGSPIYRLVANPTWTIPKSIQNGEMANVGRSYLTAHHMVMRGGWIVQQPGPDNALGLVKFDMKNDQAIYLHDTSSRQLFQRSQRQLSHGCVRVSDALGFADMLAADEGVTDQWHEARNSGEQTFVPLPHELPVRLVYGNVFVDTTNRVVFRTDPYGWNDEVAKAIGFDAASVPHATAQSIDIGP